MNNYLDQSKRIMFNINRCFVCNKSTTEIALKHCSACKMISYCNKEHQAQDWKNHKHFCKVLQEVEKEIPKVYLENKRVWLDYRMLFMNRCEIALQRKLYPYEWLMIAFPKRCEICRSTNANIICVNCLCVNYCSEEHKDKDSKFHAEHCNDLKKAMDLIVDDRPGNWSLREGIKKFPGKVEDFITSYVTITGEIDANHRQNLELKTSLQLSYPLTLVYGLTLMNFKIKSKLVFHVVGSGPPETADLKKWEIILHIYPQIKHLLIFFIGPDVIQPFKIDFCMSCKRIFEFKYVKNLYHNFVKSFEYQMPDIVCTFHPGFYFYKNTTASSPWLETLPLLLQDKPLIMTSASEYEAELDLEILHHIDSNLAVKKIKNLFASAFPFRSFEDSVAHFFNYVVCLIFKKP